MGKDGDLQAAILGSLKSTTVTSMPGFCSAITAHVGPPCFESVFVVPLEDWDPRGTYHVARANAADLLHFPDR